MRRLPPKIRCTDVVLEALLRADRDGVSRLFVCGLQLETLSNISGTTRLVANLLLNIAQAHVEAAT